MIYEVSPMASNFLGLQSRSDLRPQSNFWTAFSLFLKKINISIKKHW